MRTLTFGCIAAAMGLLTLAGCAGATDSPGFQSFSSSARGQYRAEFASNGRDGADESLELTDAATLADCRRYAALHNAGVEAAFNRWRAALAQVDQAGALPDPRFNYRYFIREIETRVGAQRQAFGLSQTFPWIGRLETRTTAAAAAARAEHHRFEAARLALQYEVTDAYYQLYELDRTVDIVGQNLRLLQRVEQVAQTRYRAAAGSQMALVRVQVEMGRLEQRLASLEDLRRPHVARLNAALNRPVDAPVPAPAAPPAVTPEVDDAQILAWLVESNPQLQAASAEIDQAAAMVEHARLGYVPDLTLGVDYIDTADPIGAMQPGDAGKDAVVLMASVNLPIWFDRIEAEIRQARHRRLAAALSREQASADLLSRTQMVLYRLHDARRQHRLYRDTLTPKANEALQVTEAAFRAGNADLTALLDAQRVLLEFELAAERAAVARAQRLAELEMLVGRPVPTVEEPSRSEP